MGKSTQNPPEESQVSRRISIPVQPSAVGGRSFDRELYETAIRTLSNRQLIDEASDKILGAAVMGGMRSCDGWEDECSSACYREASRRGNSDLYVRAFNSVLESQGHTPREIPTLPVELGEGLRDQVS